MTQTFELTIHGDVPDDNADLGPEAIVNTKAAAHEIVEALHKLGLLHVKQTRRVVRRNAAKQTATLPAVAMSEPTGTDLPQRGAAHRHATAAE